MERKEDAAGEGAGGGGPLMKRKKRRLGGGGLSLEAFASAKSKPIVTASQIRKQRQLYQNAKKVQKYRKLVKHLAEEGHAIEAQRNVPSRDAKQYQRGAERKQSISDEDQLGPSAVKGKQAVSARKNSDTNKKESIGAFKRYHSKVRAPTHREEYDKKKAQEEMEWKERQEAITMQQAAQNKAHKERKKVQSKMRKKTERGQPVMKHRVQQILDTLERQLTE